MQFDRIGLLFGGISALLMAFAFAFTDMRGASDSMLGASFVLWSLFLAARKEP